MDEESSAEEVMEDDQENTEDMEDVDDEGDEDDMDEEDSDEEENDDDQGGEDSRDEEMGEDSMEESLEEDSEESTLTASQEEAVALMIDEDYAENRWTQEYCSTHVGFCVPVHKNWYFKSFGATASLLWHVEMGASEVADFGDGPLEVDLKMAALETLGVSDGDVRTIGGKVIGYRSWSDNRHFEISAVAELKDPVMYVTENLRGPE